MALLLSAAVLLSAWLPVFSQTVLEAPLGEPLLVPSLSPGPALAHTAAELVPLQTLPALGLGAVGEVWDEGRVVRSAASRTGLVGVLARSRARNWTPRGLAAASAARVYAKGRRLFEGGGPIGFQAAVEAADLGGLGSRSFSSGLRARERENSEGALTFRILPLAPPSGFRDSLFYYRILLNSFYFYNVPRVTSPWRQLRAFQAKTSPGERPVAHPRRFLADLRLLGTSGRFYVLGYEALSDGEVAREARAIYARHFPPDQEAAASFERFLQRTEVFNPRRRSSNFRKNLRDAFMLAAATPRSKLAALFDGSNTAEQRKAREAFEREGLAENLEAFRRVVAQTVLEEAPGPDRVLGVVLSGSYPSGAAGPASDFDFEVLTADGSSRRAKAFVGRLRAHWEGEGRTQELAPHSYVLWTSPGLLTRIHWEALEVVSPYPEVLARMASRGPPAFQPSRERAWWSGAVVAFLKALTVGVTYAVDLAENRLRPAGLEPPALVNRALYGLYFARVVSLSLYSLYSIALPRLVNDIAGQGHFIGAFSLLNTLSSITLIAAAFLNGILIDKWGARRAMIVGALGRAGFMFLVPGLVRAGVLSYGLFVPLALANGACFSLALVGESAVLPEILKDHPERLQRTNAILELTFSATAAIGYLIGGPIVRALGALPIFLLYGLAHLLIIAPCYWLSLPARSETARASGDAPRTRTGGLRRFSGELFRGLRFLLRDPTSRRILIFTMVFSALILPLRSTIVPIINKVVYGGDPVALGRMFAAVYIGKAAGDLTAYLKEKKLGRAALLRAATLGFASLGLLLPPLGSAAILGSLALVNFFTAFANIALRSMFQERVRLAEGDVGKLMGIQGGIYNLSTTLGNIFMGLAFTGLAYGGALGALEILFGLGAILFWCAPRILAVRAEDPAAGRRKD